MVSSTGKPAKLGVMRLAPLGSCLGLFLTLAACTKQPQPAAVGTPTPTPAASQQPPVALNTAPQSAPRASSPREAQLTVSLKVRQLADGVWIHISTDEHGYPANGALVKTDNAVVLVDTTWTDGQARALLSYIKSDLHLTLTSAVVTHSHPDRSGGLPALLEQGIPVELTAETAKRLPNVSSPQLRSHALAPGDSFASPGGYEIFFPGQGHAADNVVVWFPKQQFLFAGCLIKAKEAGELGFIADANVAEWPAAVQRVEARYPSAKIMVPGHGEPGDASTLEHTIELLKLKQATLSK